VIKMKNKIISVSLIVIAILALTGCNLLDRTGYKSYSDSFFDTFNTLVQFSAYTESEEEFRLYFDHVHSRLLQLHRFYDIYNTYEGINNVKTINDQAGIAPVKVEQEIIDLILFAKEWSEKTGGSTNIALGPVLKIWHRYREDGLFDPASATLPELEDLRETARYTDLNQVLVDPEANTVFLPDRRMSLDVGAVAKGYAVELVADELRAKGLESAIISAGGNVSLIGKPLDGKRDLWGVGIQNPDQSIVGSSDNLLDVLYLADAAVVSSGDYQRFYVVEDQVIHHIIDPVTLMPATYYRAVTVVARDSGVADFLSTELFLLPPERSLQLAESLNGVEALWVMPDGTLVVTEGMKNLLRSEGATNQEK
jgi:FAD:protein FMN transferase